MNVVKRVWLLGWQIGIVAGFLGLGVLGLGLMVGAIIYPTGLLWGIVVFLLGLLGFLLVFALALTQYHRPGPGPLEA